MFRDKLFYLIHYVGDQLDQAIHRGACRGRDVKHTDVAVLYDQEAYGVDLYARAAAAAKAPLAFDQTVASAGAKAKAYLRHGYKEYAVRRCDRLAYYGVDVYHLLDLAHCYTHHFADRRVFHVHLPFPFL